MTITKCTSTHNTQQAKGRAIEYIVIHYTAGVSSRAGAAKNTANYFKNTPREVSSDYIVDDAGAVLYNPDIANRYTWHCGGNRYLTKGGAFYGKCKNSNSIGIEICSTNESGKIPPANDPTWKFSNDAVSNAVELVRALMVEFNIGENHVIRHYDVTGKQCPGIVGWNAESGNETKWKEFKRRISGAGDETKSVLYRVRKSWLSPYTQLGAYKVLDNAKKCCPVGYSVFDESGKAVFTNYRKDWKKGEAVTIADKAQLFANESTATPSSRIPGGVYYIYDGVCCKNGRYRITTSKDKCGKTPAGKYVTGYVSIDKMS